MGSSSSQPVVDQTSAAAQTARQAIQDAATLTAKQASEITTNLSNQAAATAQQLSTVSSSRTAWQWATLVFGILTAIAVIIAIYDFVAPCDWPNIFYTKQSCSDLGTIQSAVSSADPKSVSSEGRSVIQGDIKKLQEDQKKYAIKQGPSQPILKKLWSYYMNNGSTGNLLSGSHNAETTITIKADDAPLAAEDEGAYGMQWWMFIKDWNYSYGKDKPIIQRADPTNDSILNPSISLHPTDNTLKISVSIFPSRDGGSSKSTPAPAGHSSSTDDVFICEVPDVPLQAWFAVSMTVFGRNLDVYIDGKLVKSCFLPGIPKPAAGNITVNSEGGFSGKMCTFYHFPRMITPGDAITFASAGTNCMNESGTTTTAAGSSIKVGLYDAVGKQVKEYQF